MENTKKIREISKQYYEDNKERSQQMNGDWYRRLSEKENDKKESMLEIVIGIWCRKTWKPKESMNQCLKHYKKNQSSNMLKKVKNDELQCVEAHMCTL